MTATAADEMMRQVGAVHTLLQQTGNQAGWDAAWQRGLTPWELMPGGTQPQPSLRWACESAAELKDVIPRTGKALVPGCGRGQDVAYLARRGLHAVGLDISQTAVDAACATLAGQSLDDDVRSRIEVKQADYFALQTGDVGADLVYDYTFFCAITSELHAKWAAGHAAALKPGGVLVCLVWPMKHDGSPITDNEAKQGPPYFVTPDMYTALLQPHFTHVFTGAPADVPVKKLGRETLMVWRRN